MISESTKTQATNNSVLIEFDTGNRGIILPMVDETPNLTGGTFAVNKISKSVQYSNGESWIDLTTQGELIEHNFANVGDENANGVIIGSETTSKSGVLVLESTTAALVLPKVANPHLSILSPIAGTICYDTISDSLAVFDGNTWSFWK